MSSRRERFLKKVGSFFKQVGNWVLRYPIALVISVFIVIVGVFLMLLGVDINWGGIISKMFGKNQPDTVSKANKVPEDRPQDKEDSDKHGYKQKEVEKLEESKNPFRDKSKLRVKREDGTEEKIQLPEGIKDTDVEKVYEVRPKEFEVKVKAQPDKKDLGGLKDALVVLTSLSILVMPSVVQAQDCPEGYRCLTEEQAQELKEIVEHRQCMQDALENKNGELSLNIDPYTILVTKEGQVFSKEKVTIHLDWCEYELDFKGDPDLNVQIKEKPEDGLQWGFRPRVRLGMLLHPTRIGKDPFRDLLAPALLFEPFHVGIGHFEVHTGLRSFGMGAGIDITRNMDLYGGAAFFWEDPLPVRPTIGLSLSFN